MTTSWRLAVCDLAGVDRPDIEAAFGDVFDHALLFHGFATHMRDYDLVIYTHADPRTGIRPQHLRYRFTYCVRATASSAVSPGVWRRSLDDRLIDYEEGTVVDGYVWGSNWQLLYPGMTLLPESAEADRWSDELGIPFYEATIEANSHTLALVFSDLTVTILGLGYSPFGISGPGPEGHLQPLL